MTASIPSLRRDVAAETLRLASLKAKLSATVASMTEGMTDYNTGRTGNWAHDVMTLGDDIAKAGANIFDLNCKIADIETDIAFGPTVAHLREIIEAGYPHHNVVTLPVAANQGA